jgi:hypothetical protein
MQPGTCILLKLLQWKSSESSENPRVGSSILSLGTKIMKSLLETVGFSYMPILSVDVGVIIAYYML